MRNNEQPIQFCDSLTVEREHENCPVCKGNGQKVKKATVENIVKEENKERLSQENYYLCLTPECEVVYFNQAGDNCFTKKDVNPIWFKKNNDPSPICYCKNITDEDKINHIVMEKCCSSMEDIKRHTGANTGCECLTKNPAGK